MFMPEKLCDSTMYEAKSKALMSHKVNMQPICALVITLMNSTLEPSREINKHCGFLPGLMQTEHYSYKRSVLDRRGIILSW